MRPQARMLAAALTGAVALSSCGVSEETKVRAVAKEFRRAIDAADGERACRLLTPRALRAIPDCPQNVASVDGGATGEGPVAISGDRATIAAPRGDAASPMADPSRPITLVKVDGTWRLDALGTRNEATTSARAAAYERCWRAAGASIATSPQDLAFAAADTPVIAVREDRVSAKGGNWRIFYALAPGTRDPGLEEVIAEPKRAAAVAYVENAGDRPEVVNRARSCTSGG